MNDVSTVFAGVGAMVTGMMAYFTRSLAANAGREAKAAVEQAKLGWDSSSRRWGRWDCQ